MFNLSYPTSFGRVIANIYTKLSYLYTFIIHIYREFMNKTNSKYNEEFVDKGKIDGNGMWKDVPLYFRKYRKM